VRNIACSTCSSAPRFVACQQLFARPPFAVDAVEHSETGATPKTCAGIWREASECREIPVYRDYTAARTIPGIFALVKMTTGAACAAR
jgi:hypothetical protein